MSDVLQESTYLAALKEYIEIEYATNSTTIKDMWAQPLDTRISEGEAIGDVEIVQTDERFLLARCADNISKFREGDSLRLHRGDPTAAERVSCSLDEDRGDEMLLHAGYGYAHLSVTPGKGWLLDRDIADTRKQIIGAFDELDEAPAIRRALLDILQGRALPEVDPGKRDAALVEAARKGLRGKQKEAYACALSTRNYYLVQGPPGTGKTWVLSSLAETLAQRGERVLITSFTHRGINNALKKIHETTGYKHLLKVGQRQQSRDLKWDGGSIRSVEYFTDGPYKPNQTGLIVGSTAFALRSKRLSSVRFDTIIIDEAGQLSVPLALVAMLSGKRFIFIGDHQQMAPVIAGKHTEPWVRRSVFETLFSHAPGTMLDVTYRMNEQVNDFPSRRFYSGKLKSSEEAAPKRIVYSKAPGRFKEILDPEKSVVFAEISHVGNTMRSEEEAEVAAQLTIEAVLCGVPEGQIAIIAPFRAQGRLIRNRLKHLAEKRGVKGIDAIMVDTVERIQGQERDLIIISLTASDPLYAAAKADFYFQPNRLNVSITRARVKCIIIGSPKLFEARPEADMQRMWVKNFVALHNHSHVVRIPPGEYSSRFALGQSIRMTAKSGNQADEAKKATEPSSDLLERFAELEAEYLLMKVMLHYDKVDRGLVPGGVPVSKPMDDESRRFALERFAKIEAEYLLMKAMIHHDKVNRGLDEKSRHEICSNCEGKGRETCWECDGGGTVPCWKCKICNTVPCPRCKGVETVLCQGCGGYGTVDHGGHYESECQECSGLGTIAHGGCDENETNPCLGCPEKGDSYGQCSGDETESCPECDGSGTVNHKGRAGKVIAPCLVCGGSGIVPDNGCYDEQCPENGMETCPTCDGDGTIQCMACEKNGG